MIQRLHFLAMRTLVVALLPILRLLMLPQPHNLSGLRAHVRQIQHSRCQDRRQEVEGEFVRWELFRGGDQRGVARGRGVS